MTVPHSESRVLLIPRWAGTQDSDWYPWLCQQIPGVVVMPGLPKVARPPAWKAAVSNALAEHPLGDTIVVTHSLGMHGLVQALSEDGQGVALKGAVMVAGWFDISRAFWDQIGEPWEAITPWLDYPYDGQVVRRRLGRAIALVGDNDPIVESPAPVTASRLEERLGCDARICPGMGHFNRREQPDVVSAVNTLRG